MRKVSTIRSLAALVLAAGLGLWGCRKGGPAGADTTAKVAAKITVKVIEKGSAVAGIAVQATDPAGVTSSGVTDAQGVVVFDAERVGLWTLTVPTQGNFFHSQTQVTVDKTSTAPQVVFTADGRQFIVTELTLPQYGVFGGDVRFKVDYFQPAALKIPLVLEIEDAANVFPSAWQHSFSPVTVGGTSQSSVLAITVPRGSFEEPTFKILGRRMDARDDIKTADLTVRRDFAIQSTLFIEKEISGSPRGLAGKISLSTLNAGDSETTWVGSLGFRTYLGGSEICQTGITLTAETGTFFSLGCGSGTFYTFTLRSTEVKPVTLWGNVNRISFEMNWTSAVAEVRSNTEIFNSIKVGDVLILTR